MPINNTFVMMSVISCFATGAVFFLSAAYFAFFIPMFVTLAIFMMLPFGFMFVLMGAYLYHYQEDKEARQRMEIA